MTNGESVRPDGLPGPIQARRPQDFDAMYAAGTPPWDIGRPQPAFAQLLAQGRLTGRVLDVGCGTGEHTLMAAAARLDATGIDMSPTAIDMAQHKAEDRGVTATFRVADALELQSLGQSFDTVLDCGLFHVFEDADRPAFVAGLRASIATGGRYHMLCFSDRQPGDWGPRRIRQEEIRAAFTDGWEIESIEPTVLEITISEDGAQAWLAVIRRTN